MAKRNAKGEGSFKENADGTITHRKCIGYKSDGNRKTITVTEKTKAACIREMKKKEDAWKKQQQCETVLPGTTVAELCNMHLVYQVEQDELKPKSIDRRECTIDNHIAAYPIGNLQAQAVRVADVDGHISGLIKNSTLSVSSIEKVVDVLNAAYNWAIVRGDLQFNPVAPLKPTFTKRLQKIESRTVDEADVAVLSEEEEKIFIEEALKVKEKSGKPKYVAGRFGLLLLHTGMRCGEMLALRWADVDFDNGYLVIEKSRSVAKNRQGTAEDNKYVTVEGTTKNEKARRIKLKREALDVLRELRAESPDARLDELIVRTRTGKGNTATNLEHRMETIFKNAGLTELSGGLHIFRRTFATRMYEQGARTKEIAAYIGDLESTTEQYYIAVRKKVKEGDQTKQVVMLPVEEKIEPPIRMQRGMVRCPW